ncbi:GNAT family N-acetyltransferase [Nocardiopsis nanhaiensis]
MLELRTFRSEDTRALERLVQRLWPLSSHPGGLGWELAIEAVGQDTLLAHRGGELVAWADIAAPNAFSAHAEISLQGASADPEAGAALLDWALTEAGDAEVNLLVFDGDAELGALAEKAGFVAPGEDDSDDWMCRAATEEDAVLPEGYRIRPVREGEEEARVECHRTAWKPIDLPWPGRENPPDPDRTSRFSRERYDNTRASLLYDRELDLVVEAPDGALAACCVVWWDPRNRCSEIEPLGVVPEHRRRGLASALALAACSLTARRGGDRVFINVSPDLPYQTPAKTYASVGYVPVRRGRLYTGPAR